MAGIKVDVTDNSDKVRQAMEQQAEKILTMLGIQAEKHAKELITEQGAIDTGLLRNSITWAIGGERPNTREYKADRGDGKGQYTTNAETRNEPCVYIGTNVEYATFIELGTTRMSPRPYIKPAIFNYQDEYKKIIESGLKGE